MTSPEFPASPLSIHLPSPPTPIWSIYLPIYLSACLPHPPPSRASSRTQTERRPPKGPSPKPSAPCPRPSAFWCPSSFGIFLSSLHLDLDLDGQVHNDGSFDVTRLDGELLPGQPGCVQHGAQSLHFEHLASCGVNSPAPSSQHRAYFR